VTGFDRERRARLHSGLKCRSSGGARGAARASPPVAASEVGCLFARRLSAPPVRRGSSIALASSTG
jgi:hypothetical protein